MLYNPVKLLESLGISRYSIDYKNKIIRLNRKGLEAVMFYFGFYTPQTIFKEAGWIFCNINSEETKFLLTKKEGF